MGNSHFNIGVETYNHRGRDVIAAVGNNSYDTFLSKLSDSMEYDIGYIPAGYEHRPDRISALFYGTADYWWLLLLVNNIPDPLQGLNEGDEIFIPKL